MVQVVARLQSARQRLHGAEDRAQVIEAAAHEQFVVPAGQGGPSDIVHDQVPGDDGVGGNIDDRGEVLAQVALSGLAQRPDRCHVALGVELEPLRADLAVEVDGQLRDAQHGLVDVYRHRLHVAFAVHHRDLAREAQIAVDP